MKKTRRSARCVPAIELNCWRFGGPVVLLIFWGCYKKIPLKQPKNRILPLCLLSVAVAVNNYTYFGSMEYIAVGVAETLSVSIPLFFTTAVSILFLGERMGFLKVLSLTMCLLGTVFIIQPDFFFHGVPLGYFGPKEFIAVHRTNTLNETYESGSSTNVTLIDEIQINSKSKEIIGYIMLVTYGISECATVYLIRGTTITEVSCEAQLIWTHLLSLLVSLVLMLIFEHPVVPPDMKMSFFLTGHVGFSFLATLTYFVALNFASGVLVKLNYSIGIVLSMLSQYFVVSNIKPGHRNILEILGACCTLIAGFINPVHQLITNHFNKPKDY